MKLPDQRDFYQGKFDLDGRSAWRKFGGLTVDQAYEKFCENPLSCEENFMFMGNSAFIFYFPVIDKYIREKELRIAFSDNTYILCVGIELRLEKERRLAAGISRLRAKREKPLPAHVHNQIINLCQFILESLESPGVKKTSADLIIEAGGPPAPSWFHTFSDIKTVCTNLLVALGGRD